MKLLSCVGPSSHLRMSSFGLLFTSLRRVNYPCSQLYLLQHLPIQLKVKYILFRGRWADLTLFVPLEGVNHAS